jgi:hypothetical protein
MRLIPVPVTGCLRCFPRNLALYRPSPFCLPAPFSACLSACPSAFTLPAFPHFRLPSPKLPTVDLSVQAKVKPPLVWHGDLPGASADREWRREPSSTNANTSFRQNRILRPSRTNDAWLTQWFPGTGLARPTASPHRLSYALRDTICDSSPDRYRRRTRMSGRQDSTFIERTHTNSSSHRLACTDSRYR